MAEEGLAAAEDSVAGLALVAAFFSHPANVSATQHRPAFNKRPEGAGRWVAFGGEHIAPRMTRQCFRRSPLGVRTAERRKRTGCMTPL